MLSDEQRAELVEWLGEHENISAQASEIVATGKTLDYYIGCWGTPQKSAALADGSAVAAKAICF
ncbi:MAG: hypothetical protein GKS00_02675 [Alphaproteobacteria bacterium]|nr:hypothetical protein [Alphaproteobacteria bacterium]